MNQNAHDPKQWLRESLQRFDREAQRTTIATPRYRCRVIRWGSGPPLVFIHGLSDEARSFAQVMAALSSDFTCFAYELPNGLEDHAAIAREQHDDHVTDLLALLDHFHLESTAILGSSFGSTITLAALARAPGRFTRAILQGGFARRPLGLVEKALARFARLCPGRMGSLPGRRYAMARLDKPAFVAAPPEAYEFFLSCAGKTPIAAAGRRALILSQLDLRPLLPTIPQPVLMIGGDRDTIVPCCYEEETLAGLRDVRRLELPLCGHYPQYTHPLRMAAAIRSFLHGNSGLVDEPENHS